MKHQNDLINLDPIKTGDYGCWTTMHDEGMFNRAVL